MIRQSSREVMTIPAAAIFRLLAASLPVEPSQRELRSSTLTQHIQLIDKGTLLKKGYLIALSMLCSLRTLV